MNPRFSNITRRDFLGRTAAGIGAGLVLGAPGILRAAHAAESDKIHVGLIGMGRQGGVLFDAMRNIPGLHLQAVCDIWDYSRTLDNFFAAIRGKARLNCDARTAFLSEAPVYWVNSSARKKEPIVFTRDQLAVYAHPCPFGQLTFC